MTLVQAVESLLRQWKVSREPQTATVPLSAIQQLATVARDKANPPELTVIYVVGSDGYKTESAAREAVKKLLSETLSGGDNSRVHRLLQWVEHYHGFDEMTEAANELLNTERYSIQEVTIK